MTLDSVGRLSFRKALTPPLQTMASSGELTTEQRQAMLGETRGVELGEAEVEAISKAHLRW